MSIKYKVVEIFDSIDGEGIRTGLPVSFIRLAGCNLRCVYCDTRYALFGEAESCKYVEMTEDEILKKMNPLFGRITLTGGEPLIANGVDKLLKSLSDNGFEINIETNGAANIESFTEISENIFFTIDYKLPSSGMCEKMYWNNFLKLTPKDVIKFVVGAESDILHMLKIIKTLKEYYAEMPHIFIGAVYEKFSLEKLVSLIISEPLLADARIQIQLHKIIWEPDKRGV